MRTTRGPFYKEWKQPPYLQKVTGGRARCGGYGDLPAVVLGVSRWVLQELRKLITLDALPRCLSPFQSPIMWRIESVPKTTPCQGDRAAPMLWFPAHRSSDAAWGCCFPLTDHVWSALGKPHEMRKVSECFLLRLTSCKLHGVHSSSRGRYGRIKFREKAQNRVLRRDDGGSEGERVLFLSPIRSQLTL